MAASLVGGDMTTSSFLLQTMSGNFSNQTDAPFVPPQFELNLTSMLNLTIGTLMTLTTFAGQILVFVVVANDVRLRDASSYYISSLAVADLLISIISMPIWTLYTTMGYWPLPQYACDLWNCSDFCLCATSINVILFISIDRYLCLRYPFQYPLKRTDAISKVALGVIWVATFITYAAYIGTTQVLLGVNRDIYDCGVHFLESVPATLVLMIIVLWSPIFGTMIIYFLIYKIAAKVAEAQKANKMGTLHLKEGKDKGNEKSGEDELKAVKTIGLLLLTFVICWLPITFGFCSNALYPGSISPWFLIICYWLGYLNSMINPICYALGNPFFKQTLKKLFTKRSY